MDDTTRGLAVLLRRQKARPEPLFRLKAPAQKPLIHPSMANRYYKAVENLRELLNQDGSKAEAQYI